MGAVVVGMEGGEPLLELVGVHLAAALGKGEIVLHLILLNARAKYTQIIE